MRDGQQQPGAGYDHAFLLDAACAGMSQPAAQLRADMEQLIAASAALGTRAPRWEEIRRAHALGAF